ncbi:hypothetical protein JL720_13721 [Aureococcus anophagefferens]|nr:hypothetical protein JL720_13721 [Aureococcus anophagefferens]
MAAQLCPVIDQTKVGAGFEEGSPVKPRQDNRGGWVLMCKCCVDGASKACARQLAGVELAYAGPADVDDLERFLDTHDVQLNPVQKSAVKFDGPSLPTGSEDPDADRRRAPGQAPAPRRRARRGPPRRRLRVLEVVAFSAATRELCLHLEDVAEAWGLATLLMFPPERNGDARWLCAKLGMREGFRTDSTRDPSRRVVAMGKVPGKRSGMRMAPIGLDATRGGRRLREPAAGAAVVLPERRAGSLTPSRTFTRLLPKTFSARKVAASPKVVDSRCVGKRGGCGELAMRRVRAWGAAVDPARADMDRFAGRQEQWDAFEAAHGFAPPKLLPPEGGSTATVLRVEGSTLTAAWVGDSRAALARRDGGAEALTSDHNAENSESERDRVEAAGGTIAAHAGADGAEGLLQVTRSLGDRAPTSGLPAGDAGPRRFGRRRGPGAVAAAARDLAADAKRKAADSRDVSNDDVTVVVVVFQAP